MFFLVNLLDSKVNLSLIIRNKYLILKYDLDIIAYMHKKNNSVYIRTTVWIPKELHVDAKITAITAKSNLSKLMTIALKDKIKIMKEDYLKKRSEDNEHS
jgi:hypothetical protein